MKVSFTCQRIVLFLYDLLMSDHCSLCLVLYQNNCFAHSNYVNVFDVDALHSMPVQQMGNYQEYLKKMPASLRELESQPARLHTFGNPFKVNKVWLPSCLLPALQELKVIKTDLDCYAFINVLGYSQLTHTHTYICIYDAESDD